MHSHKNRRPFTLLCCVPINACTQYTIEVTSFLCFKIFDSLSLEQILQLLDVPHPEKMIISCLRILTGKKHRQIKLQCLEKVRIWAFGLLVHYINYL